MEQSVRSDRVAAYLADLRPHLDDLDDTERAEVLDELADALREVAAENEGPLRDVLGPPDDYVAAYRASAGLERRTPPRSGRLRVAARRAHAELRAQPWWPRTVALAVLLRPAWWTLRGAALTAWVCTFVGISFVGIVGLLLVIAGVAASLTVGGQPQPTRQRRVALRAANGLAMLATLWLVTFAGNVRDDAWSAGYDEGQNGGVYADVAGELDRRLADGYGGQLTMPNGDPVTNIHVHTRDGEPLTDVLLYDGSGRPLRVVPRGEDFVYDRDGTEYEIEYQRDADGQRITNLYPLEQYEVEYDDTGSVTERLPRGAPTIVLPRALDAGPTAAPGAGPTTPPGSADSPTARTSEPAPAGEAGADGDRPPE